MGWWIRESRPRNQCGRAARRTAWTIPVRRCESDPMLTNLNSHPTPYADLNTVLYDLVTSAQAILRDNFCGAYLQGSFAVGDADLHSDVDFVIVTHTEVTDDQL